MEFVVIFDAHDFAESIAARANLARVHVGLSDRVTRLELILDAPELEGRALTPFDAVPELEELRRTVRRIEALAKELAGGR